MACKQIVETNRIGLSEKLLYSVKAGIEICKPVAPSATNRTTVYTLWLETITQAPRFTECRIGGACIALPADHGILGPSWNPDETTMSQHLNFVTPSSKGHRRHQSYFVLAARTTKSRSTAPAPSTDFSRESQWRFPGMPTSTSEHGRSAGLPRGPCAARNRTKPRAQWRDIHKTRGRETPRNFTVSAIISRPPNGKRTGARCFATCPPGGGGVCKSRPRLEARRCGGFR